MRIRTGIINDFIKSPGQNERCGWSAIYRIPVRKYSNDKIIVFMIL